MKFGDICNNNKVILKMPEISIGDKVTGTAHAIMVCCLCSYWREMANFSEKLVKMKMYIFYHPNTQASSKFKNSVWTPGQGPLL